VLSSQRSDEVMDILSFHNVYKDQNISLLCNIYNYLSIKKMKKENPSSLHIPSEILMKKYVKNIQ
jgi:hypothetical protein